MTVTWPWALSHCGWLLSSAFFSSPLAFFSSFVSGFFLPSGSSPLFLSSFLAPAPSLSSGFFFPSGCSLPVFSPVPLPFLAFVPWASSLSSGFFFPSGWSAPSLAAFLLQGQVRRHRNHAHTACGRVRGAGSLAGGVVAAPLFSQAGQAAPVC